MTIPIPPPVGLRGIFRLVPVLAGAVFLLLGTGMTIILLSSGRHAPTSAPEPRISRHAAVAQPSQSPRPSATASPSPSPSLAAVADPTSSPQPTGPVEFSLAAYLDNVGVVSDSQPTTGNLDGTGSAFSAQALANAGVTPGAQIAYRGVPFAWPGAAIGQPDNVTASGQTLRISGSGQKLALLVTAAWGPVSGTGTVQYADGSTQSFTLTVPDWWTGCPSATGSDVAVFTPYRDQGNGQASFTACVYYASVQLHAGSMVKGVVLPDLSPATPVSGQGSLHIFAVSIE